MKYRRFFTLVVLMWLLPLTAHAQVLVLLQGYLGPGSSWRMSGVTHILDRADWVDGGHLRIENDKVVNYRELSGQDRTFYTLKMPTEAPVMVQAKLLAKYMKDIGKQHPGESLNIAGFSAGGIIGRTYMVMRKDDEPKVATLITISTPHLGTHLAEVGSKIRRSPLSSFTPFIGAGSFDRSDALLKDMHPEEYGSFLYWLNRQTHPKARYVSVIKGGRSFIGGDFVVPAYSQNMNNVVALWGMSTTVRLTGTHMLSHVDALLLVQQMLIGQQI